MRYYLLLIACFLVALQQQPVRAQQPHTYTTEVISGVEVQAETKTSRALLREGTFVLDFRNPYTSNLTGDGILLSVTQISAAKIKYREDPTATSCVELDLGSEPLTDWKVTFGPGPNGTLNMTTSSKFGAQCDFTASFFLTNEPTIITFPNISTLLKPEQTKSSFRVRCPWRDTVAKHTGTAPGPDAILLGRYTSLDLTLSFRYTTSLVEPPTVVAPVFFANAPYTWTTWTEQQCAIAFSAGRLMKEIPYPENVIFGKSYARMKTETIDWSIDLLTWAIHDDFNVSFVNFNAFPVPGIESNFTAMGSLRLEFQDTVDYDPTLEMIFTGAGMNPDASPAAAAEGQAAVIGAAVGGTIAAVAFVAILAIIFAVPSVRKRVLPFTARREADVLRHSEILQDDDGNSGSTAGSSFNVVPDTAKHNTWVARQPKSSIE